MPADERDFAAIYSRYHQDLYRFCLAIVGCPQDAQDALQNTMVKVLRALPGEQRQIELKPWLYRIAHNESVEMLRRRRPTADLGSEQATPGSLSENAEARERLRQLIADLDQLPERQRGALVMRELSGLDYDEIGAALGTSPAVARQTLYEARLSLRQMDEGREMTCATVTEALSDADGRVTRRRDIRAHLRACPNCCGFRDELRSRRGDLAALSPLPAVVAAGLLKGLLGGSVGGSAGAGAGLAGLAGSAAHSLGAATTIKSVAAVAAIAVAGVGVAERGGVVNVTPWAAGSEQEVERAQGAAPDKDLAARSFEPSPTSAGTDGQDRAVVGERGTAGGVGNRSGSGTVANSRSSAEADATAPVAAETPTTPLAAEAPGAAGLPPTDKAESSSAASQLQGEGSAKPQPDAAADGQETAAAYKTEAQGNGKGKPAEAKPEKAAKPEKPEKPAKAAPPAESGGGTMGAPSAPPATPEPSAQPQSGPEPAPAEPKEKKEKKEKP
jgi:RNA polymerase sigma factor (sigma-70 family)